MTTALDSNYIDSVKYELDLKPVKFDAFIGALDKTYGEKFRKLAIENIFKPTVATYEEGMKALRERICSYCSGKKIEGQDQKYLAQYVQSLALGSPTFLKK